MLALAVTASHHQRDALRSAVYEHMSRESSLSVHMKVRLYLNFSALYIVLIEHS
jgi:hypothetical protein